MKTIIALLMILNFAPFALTFADIPNNLYPKHIPVVDSIFISMKDRSGGYCIYTLLESYEGYIRKGGMLIGDYFWLKHVFSSVTEFCCDNEFMLKTSGDYWLICNHCWLQDKD